MTPVRGRALPDVLRCLAFLSAILCLGLVPLAAQQYSPSLYSGMQWRQIGPFRAGRVTGVTGITRQPAIYYMGTAGGGAWKTTDGGMVWKPIFDKGRRSPRSARSPSLRPTPSVVYIGTGDVSNVGGAVNQGNGMWKSSDGGETWQHIGLEDSRHISAIRVDPKNADVVFAAALGHTFAPNEERGVFKTADGGKTWRKVLYKDDKTGAVDLSFAPDNPQIGYATMWYHYVNPDTPFAGLLGTGGAGIYKTTDGGETWQPVDIPQFAKAHLGRMGVVVGPGGQRVYLIVSERAAGGLYRSDDGGATWKKITQDERVTGTATSAKSSSIRTTGHRLCRADFVVPSTDGGVTFSSFKGAPGGDDNHALWIDPRIPLHDHGQRPGRDHQHGRRNVDLLVQPAHRPDLPRLHRQSLSLLGLRHAAGQGSVATLSRGDYGAIPFSIGTRSAPMNSAISCRARRSQHCLCRRRSARLVARRSYQSPSEGRFAERQPRRRLPHGDQSAAGVFAAGSARPLRRHAVCDGNQRRRGNLEGNQSGPDESSWRASAACARPGREEA